MTTWRARARSMLNTHSALPMLVVIGLILDHARRW